MEIAEFQESTNAWTSMEVKLPPCDKLKNFAISLEVYSPFAAKIFAFDSLRFKNCNTAKVSLRWIIILKTTSLQRF